MTVVLQLPMPPSVNRLEAKLGNTSPNVRAWRARCDALLLADRFRPPRFAEPVAVSVVWDKRAAGRRDIDNALKPLLDLLQRIEVFVDDRLVRDLRVGFGDAPAGCTVTIGRYEKET